MSSFRDIMKSKGLLGGKYSTAREEEQEVEKEVEVDVEEEDSDMETQVKNNKRDNTESVKRVVSSEGKISTPGVGFMVVPATEYSESEQVENNEEPKSKKQKLTAAEYLSRETKSKVDNRSSKANLNSLKTKYLNLKKKISAIHKECGVEEDFLLVMKNNLQKDSISRPAPTAGKYMVFCRGGIREKLLGDGIKFDKNNMYMMANDSNYEEEKIYLEEIPNDIPEGVYDVEVANHDNLPDERQEEEKEELFL